MARRSRNLQEQLAFPELQLSAAQLDTLEKRAAASSEPDAAIAPMVAQEPAREIADQIEPTTAIVRKSPRKRPVPPEMTLVQPSPETQPLPPDRPALRQRNPLNSPEAPPSAPRASIRQSAALDSANRQPFQAAPPTLPSQPPRAPIEQATAANEQFRAPQTRPSQDPLTAPAAPNPAPRAADTERQGGRLKTWAHLATISASLVAVAALVVGTNQFVETQEAQRASIALQNATLNQERITTAAEINAKAVELFIKYNEFMLQLNTPPGKNGRKETRYWKENLAVNLLESLFNLTRGNKDWETTVGWALEKHGRFIREQRLSCATYSNEFVHYLEKTLALRGPLLCRDQPPPG